MSPQLPLLLMLKKESQKKIARAQDMMVEEMQRSFKNVVLHGGTAIWRCYKGNRFSEDIDVYLPKDDDELTLFFDNLKKRGFNIKKKKISESSIFSSLKLENTVVRFEAVFKLVKGELKEYEGVDGNALTLRTLLPEELMREKVQAYLKRRKIRDLYDIFFLLRYVNNKTSVADDLNNFLKEFKNPLDEKELAQLIISGLVPKTSEMLNYIQREAK